MRTKNSVFIATSLDGYIADKAGNIDWLNSTPNPDQIDMGYSSFMENIDALVMGRTTFETVCSLDMDWPYQKPVFVLSNSMSEIPHNLKNNVFLINGELESIPPSNSGILSTFLYTSSMIISSSTTSVVGSSDFPSEEAFAHAPR